MIAAASEIAVEAFAPIVPLDVPAVAAPVPRRRIAVLGSTGSIGTATLDLARRFPDRIQVIGLAGGRNVELFARQVNEFSPKVAVLADESVSARRALAELCPRSATRFEFGDEAVAALAGHIEVDAVVGAIVGMAGFLSVREAIHAGKHVALANKESIVCGGALFAREVRSSRATLVPVDSEHSALFQCLRGAPLRGEERLVLTASGGPFFRTPVAELAGITPDQAQRHPTWRMGRKITIDSATLMNKALELIEAHWLFGVPEDRIEVVIHPQSIVHSMVRFRDGNLLAQLSVPDMRGAIGYALSFPYDRLPDTVPPLEWPKAGTLEFIPADEMRFRALALARDCVRAGGGAGTVLNAANEAAVARFEACSLRFDQIVGAVESALESLASNTVSTFEDLAALADEARVHVERWQG